MKKNGIAQSLHRIRAGAGQSLQELAQKTGLSLPYLSRVENDKANISVVNLRLIANALGVPLATFFMDEAQSTIKLSSKSQHRKLVLNVCNGRKVTEEWLLTDPEAKLEPAIITMPSGTYSNPLSHEGFEFIWLISGEISYTVGSEIYQLVRDDVLYYPAVLSHHFANDGKKKAVFLVVATPWSY